MASEASSTSSSQPAKDEKETIAAAFNHLVQGKRHLLVRDISSAVTSLAKACELLAIKYGELATECGDAYLHYGIALLEMARTETGILSNQSNADVIGTPDDEDDKEENSSEGEEEDEEEEEEKSTDGCVESGTDPTANNADSKECAVSSSDTAPRKDSEAKSEDVDSDKAEEKKEVPREVAPVASSSAAVDVEAKPGTSDSKPDEQASEEVSNLELAWEVLELAKVIYKRQDASKRGMQLKLAEVYSKLGEVAMESENYEQSIEDLSMCLRIQMEFLPTDDRIIAETYYNLGLVYSLCNQFDISIDNFKSSMGILQARTDNLKKNIADKTFPNVPGVEDPAAVAQSEIDELAKLIEEMVEKIADIEDLKKNNETKLSEKLDTDIILAKANEAFNVETGKLVPEVKPVSNIGHLVRKKRRPDECDGDASTSSDKEPKKTRLQTGTNNGTTEAEKETQVNGVSSTEMEATPSKQISQADETPGEAMAQ